MAELGEAVDRSDDVAPVRAFWEGLGLPGLFDVHVHFLPPNIQKRGVAVFDAAGPKIGREWPIRYRQSHEERVELLRAMGVRRFSTLPYAHKPGVATYLNDWSRTFAADVPEVLWSGTFYPEEGVTAYVAELVDAGVELFKLHLQVGEFHLDDPLLDDVWGLLEDADVPVVVHAGSGPVGNDFTGPGSMQRLLERHPRLPIIVAHMGAPEVVRLPAAGRALRAGAAGHHDGVHRLLRAPYPRLAGAAAGRPAAARSCSAPTSRPSRTPTCTSSRGWPASTSATTGCGRSAGRTASSCSGPSGPPYPSDLRE